MDDLSKIIARRKRQDRIFNAIGIGCTSIGLITLLTLLGNLLLKGLGEIDWDFLTRYFSYDPNKAGILAAWTGSLLVMLVTACTAVPLGVAAGVYLEEYGRKGRLNQLIEINISNLAGVPSVIYGLMALALLANPIWIGETQITEGFGDTAVTGGLTLAMLILPIVIVATREALRSIPTHIREAAYALGATKWQVIRHHLLPYSLGGISTGVIIALSRAIGEAAPLVLVGAVAFIPFLPTLDSQFTVLPIQMFYWTTEPAPAFHRLAAATGIVLIAITLSLNAVAIVVRYRARKRIKW